MLGGALLALGQPGPPAVAYRRALLLGLATGAGYVAARRWPGWPGHGPGAQEEALGHVAEIMERVSLERRLGSPCGGRRPGGPCLACYEALPAAGDQEPTAGAALAAGHRLLLERRRSPAPGGRQGYLEGVPSAGSLAGLGAALRQRPRSRPAVRRAGPLPPPGPPPAPAALLLAR